MEPLYGMHFNLEVILEMGLKTLLIFIYSPIVHILLTTKCDLTPPTPSILHIVTDTQYNDVNTNTGDIGIPLHYHFHTNLSKLKVYPLKTHQFSLTPIFQTF